jgi:peptidoglycan/xylan/chitin deacetylase (PgdA/CDA1 family)
MRAILTYHSIDVSGSPISCSPDAFARHIVWLTSGAVRVTTVDDLLTLPDDANAVALTFDDGFANFKDEAAPRLLEHDLPVTLFVVTGFVGQTNSWDDGPDRVSPSLRLLDWPDLGALQEAGVRLGAHSVTHRRLPGLSASALEEEVHGSAEQINKHTGRKPGGFAYPFGQWNAESSLIVSRTFHWGCTTEFRALSDHAEVFALPRLDMYYFQAPGSLDGWGRPSFQARLRMRHGLRTARRLMARPGGS